MEKLLDVMRGKDGKLIEANIKWQVVQVLRGKMVKVLRGSCKQEQMVQRRRSSRGRAKRLWKDGEDRISGDRIRDQWLR